MKLKNTRLGFTLIELLVVITIIGILATGAVGVYTSQIQKARDTTRITDMSALKGGLEQAFQDIGMYPGKATTIATTTECNMSANTDNSDSSVYCTVSLGFLNSLPKDPKSGMAGNGSSLIYTYNVSNSNGVANQVYEISMGVEADGFRTSKASNTNDGGNDENRVEFGIPGVGLITGVNANAEAATDSTSAANTTVSCELLTGGAGVVVIKGNCP